MYFCVAVIIFQEIAMVCLYEKTYQYLRRVPYNYIFLAAYCLAHAYIVGFLCVKFAP